MDRKDFTIGVLSTTAAILFVGMVIVQTSLPRAVADGMTTSSSTYIMTVGSLNQADEELVYLIDTAADRMIAYRFDSNRRQLELVQGLDLAEIRKATAGPDQPPGAQPTKPRTRQP